MDINVFVETVKKMRAAQKGFFSSDKNSSQRHVFLKESRTYEGLVDKMIADYKSPQIDIFKS